MMKKSFALIAGLGLFLMGLDALMAQNKNVSLEDVWMYYRFSPKGVYGLDFMKDGQHYTTLDQTKNGKAIVKYSLVTGDTVAEIVNEDKLKEIAGKNFTFNSYSFSDDESKLLLATETEAIYRHSTQSFYYVYDIANKTLSPIHESEKQRYATFSPTENKVAYVRANNLYVKDLNTGEEFAITHDGEKNKIINGATDWVYEEEFSFDRAFFWNASGSHIAYYRFDESEVPEFSMDVYGSGLYPKQDVFKYPKAGERNAEVTAHIYELATGKKTNLLEGVEYEYIPRIKAAADPNFFVVYTMERHQNELKLWWVDTRNSKHELRFTETDKAWVDITDDIRFLEDGSFIWTSERDGYNHLYQVSPRGKTKQITKGKWDVTQFYGYDAESKTLYYESAEAHPSQRQVYSIGLNGRKKTRLTPDEGWNTAEFTPDFSYFIHNHSASDKVPTVVLRNNEGEQIKVMENNEKLSETIGGYTLSQKEFFSIKTETGHELNAWMIKPADFDLAKKYPVLMFVYGGPGSQTVKNQFDAFNGMYYQHLASEGYIVVSVDNRGTGARGRDFKKATYLNLGEIETEDQITSAKYLTTLPYVDATRIGIWGWSYGGYMSSLCITKGADVFKAAIAVAPVTNWRFYDSIYTERYMRTPQENEEGYDDNSPINHVRKLKGKYFLVHGTADDNVHVQNAMRMINALVYANKQFDMFLYPDKNHGIYGGVTRYHLYKKMTDFLLENL